MAVLVGGFVATAAPVVASTDTPATKTTYVVLTAVGQSLDAARAAVENAGGTVVRVNSDIGMLTVTATNANFADETRAGGVGGVARDRIVGEVPVDTATNRDDVEKLTAERAAARGSSHEHVKAAPADEPLADLQWDMKMIGATSDGSYKVQPGRRAVTVGIIDTGVDGTHPDIAPNFNAELSRNFTTDIPAIDGPCEHPSCVDPNNEDDDGHGTHVAGTIAAPINGLGMAGVAPNVTIVNLRAGQDSGFFFLEPTLNALTFAGRHGIDVVNMSFYTDPWLYNCTSNPADSPEAQAEQRTIIDATTRALKFARRNGVTLVAAAGNENTDLNFPGVDASSPDYPLDTAYPRTIDRATCLSMPSEGPGVIKVSAIGPSGRKAYYSNWGINQIDVSAPGGDFRDFFGTPQYRTPENLILAPYPLNVAVANGDIDPNTGESLTPFVVRDCNGDVCGLYQYIQGTSMASPHAAGVAALVVSAHGEWMGKYKGWGMEPRNVAKVLFRTATQTPCPAENPLIYPDRPANYNALCVGDAAYNGFYGHGIVNALAAVSGGDDDNHGDEGHGGEHDD